LLQNKIRIWDLFGLLDRPLQEDVAKHLQVLFAIEVVADVRLGCVTNPL
jgi:hypothetical protein